MSKRELTFDPETGAIYISLPPARGESNTVVKTVEVGSRMNYDLNDKGSVIGIEIL